MYVLYSAKISEDFSNPKLSEIITISKQRTSSRQPGNILGCDAFRIRIRR
jgi:hypothetical protein